MLEWDSWAFSPEISFITPHSCEPVVLLAVAWPSVTVSISNARMLFYLSDCLPIQELSSTRSNARMLFYLSDCLPIQELSSTRSSCAPPLPHLVVQQPRPVVFVSRTFAHYSLPLLVEESSTAHDLRHPRHHPPQRIRRVVCTKCWIWGYDSLSLLCRISH